MSRQRSATAAATARGRARLPPAKPARTVRAARGHPRMAIRMWQGERSTEEDFRGHHYRATRLLNVPQSISRSRVPILIGGGGEKRTLRLVAQYADASNLFGGPDHDAKVRDPGRALRGCRARLRRDRADEPPACQAAAHGARRRSRQIESSIPSAGWPRRASSTSSSA